MNKHHLKKNQPCQIFLLYILCLGYYYAFRNVLICKIKRHVFFLTLILVFIVYQTNNQRAFLKANYLVTVCLMLGGMVVYISAISIKLKGY